MGQIIRSTQNVISFCGAAVFLRGRCHSAGPMSDTQLLHHAVDKFPPSTKYSPLTHRYQAVILRIPYVANNLAARGEAGYVNNLLIMVSHACVRRV